VRKRRRGIEGKGLGQRRRRRTSPVHFSTASQHLPEETRKITKFSEESPSNLQLNSGKLIFLLHFQFPVAYHVRTTV
jgi:hypothetical protein